VGRWLIAEGDSIEEYQPLLEVETDKVNTEIPAPASGVLLKVLVPEGKTVNAGTVLALIGQPDEALPGVPPERDEVSINQGAPLADEPKMRLMSKGKPTEDNGPIREKPTGRAVISPAVAKIAAEHGIDLGTADIPGSGRGGRITKSDILAYVKRFQSEIVPHTSLRQAIAEHMLRSVRTSPHATTVMEVDMSSVVAYRESYNAESQEQKGLRLTFTPFFIQAVVEALKAVPEANSSYTDQGILLHRQINIGIAVALDTGLIVPVIRDADRRGLSGLQQAVAELAERARKGKLTPDEVRGSTFTVTNHGVSGSLFATPIINQPNAGILGVGAVQKRPVVVTVDGADSIAISPMCYLSFTFDHRIMDGVTADRFLTSLIAVLEKWD
jgi:2-oxoglutarate dehydrogenase E2 component (dihydrolipoamide succinyltransferase)